MRKPKYMPVKRMWAAAEPRWHGFMRIAANIVALEHLAPEGTI